MCFYLTANHVIISTITMFQLITTDLEYQQVSKMYLVQNLISTMDYLLKIILHHIILSVKFYVKNDCKYDHYL